MSNRFRHIPQKIRISSPVPLIILNLALFSCLWLSVSYPRRYFDNVGGMHFEAAMGALRAHGRVAVCGGITHYCEGERQPERFFPTDMIYTFQRVEGFMCAPWLSGARGNFLGDMSRWLGEGKVVVEETRFSGIEQWPAAFRSLFTGANTGKVVVDVA